MILRAPVRNLFRKILLLAALAGSGLSAFAAPPVETSAPVRLSEDTSIKVMTYNIRVGSGRDGPDRWELRKSRLIQMMRRHPAEAIGLQEAQAGQLDDLRAAFPRYRILGEGRKKGKNAGEFSAIMYDAQRLQPIRSDTFWLSDTPSVPGSKSWGNKFERICTWAHFRDLKTGKRFYHFNTHLDHQSQPSRVKGTDLILRRIEERTSKDPVILTGDLNAREKNPVNLSIRKAGFRDTFRELHPDAAAVGTTNGFRVKRGDHKIDFIYVDPSWSVKQSGILTDKIDGRWPSDHLPVTATVSQ